MFKMTVKPPYTHISQCYYTDLLMGAFVFFTDHCTSKTVKSFLICKNKSQVIVEL